MKILLLMFIEKLKIIQNLKHLMILHHQMKKKLEKLVKLANIV